MLKILPGRFRLPSADAHSVQINGTEANVDEANEIVSGLTFTADGKADITILVSGDRTQFVENTIHYCGKSACGSNPNLCAATAGQDVKDTTRES